MVHEVATSQSQAAHAALGRSLQFEWCHLQEVIPDSANFLLHFEVLLMMYSTLYDWVVQFLSMRYVCLVFQLDLVAWVSMIH